MGTVDGRHSGRRRKQQSSIRGSPGENRCFGTKCFQPRARRHFIFVLALDFSLCTTDKPARFVADMPDWLTVANSLHGTAVVQALQPDNFQVRLERLTEIN